MNFLAQARATGAARTELAVISGPGSADGFYDRLGPATGRGTSFQRRIPNGTYRYDFGIGAAEGLRTTGVRKHTVDQWNVFRGEAQSGALLCAALGEMQSNPARSLTALPDCGLRRGSPILRPGE
jgi:hypothetical protein